VGKFLESINALSNWSGKVFSFLTIATIAVIIPEVIGRYAFTHSFLFVHDLVWFFCGSLYILGGAYTLLRDGHVKVDIVYVKLQPHIRAILDVVTFPIFCCFCVLLIWQGGIGFWEAFKTLEVTVTPWGGPIWLLRLTIPIGASLLLLQGLGKFIRDFNVAIGRKAKYDN